MAKDYGFTAEIEELRKKFNIRGDRLQKYLEACGVKDEWEALGAIKAKYETAAKPLETDENNRVDGDKAGPTEPINFPYNGEVSAPSHGGECDADVENCDDAVSKREAIDGRSTITVSEKLYVHRTSIAVDPIKHPVTGLPL